MADNTPRNPGQDPTKNKFTASPYSLGCAMACTLSAVLLLAACNKSPATAEPENAAVPAKSTEPSPPARKPLLLLASDTLTLKQQEVLERQTLTGTLEPAQKALVRSKVTGNINQVLRREGEAVRKGQAVVVIDPTEARLRVNEREAAWLAAKAQAGNAQVQYDNSKRLAEQNFVSETALLNAKANLDAAQAQVGVAKAQLDLARQALADTTVTAPFDGQLGPVSAQTGSKVSPDSPLFEILNLKKLELKAEASPEQLGNLQPGQIATLSHGASDQDGGPNNQVLSAKLIRISPGNLAGTRTVPVYFSIDNPELRLRAGQFVTATLLTDAKRQGLLMPVVSIREAQGKPIVYRLNSQSIEVVPVQLGEETSDPQTGQRLVEIVSGLNAGDTVVAVNLGPLPEGAPVQIDNAGQ